jgi:hypothetical protein
MEKKSNPTARVFAILLTILFVVTATTSLWLINSLWQAFNPELYKQALTESGVYEQLPQLIGEQIVHAFNQNPCLQDPTECSEEQLQSTPAYLSSVDASEWAAVISKLVDPVWFKAQIESALDQVLTSVTTPGEPFSLDISLVELKTRLGGEDGYLAIVALLNSLEPCTIDDLFILPGTLLESDDPVSLPLCRPSETVLKLGESTLRDTLKVAADKLPDNTSALIETALPGMGTGLAVTQRSLQLIRTIALISPAIPIFLLLVITLLVVRSLKGFLRWWGYPLLATAAITLLASILITPIVRAIVLARVNAIGLAPGWIEIIQAAILQVAQAFRNSLVGQSLILGIIGTGMVIAAGLIRSKSEPKPD